MVLTPRSHLSGCLWKHIFFQSFARPWSHAFRNISQNIYVPNWQISLASFCCSDIFTPFSKKYVSILRAIFVRPWKMVSASVRYLFYQPIDVKIKHGLFVFPPKKTLYHWTRHCWIGQSCCSMTSKWHIDQSNRSISVRLLFLFCSCVIISRSYKNRSNVLKLFSPILKKTQKRERAPVWRMTSPFVHKHETTIKSFQKPAILVPENAVCMGTEG